MTRHRNTSFRLVQHKMHVFHSILSGYSYHAPTVPTAYTEYTKINETFIAQVNTFCALKGFKSDYFLVIRHLVTKKNSNQKGFFCCSDLKIFFKVEKGRYQVVGTCYF